MRLNYGSPDCRHGVHNLCWVRMTHASEEDPELPLCCPLCRATKGNGVVYQFNQALFNEHNGLILADGEGVAVPTTDTEPEADVAHSSTGEDREGSIFEFYSAGCERVYLSHTSLPNGKLGLIVDPGSVWDLAGSQWAGAVAYQAHLNGLRPNCHRRGSPLKISGVGQGSQHCAFDSHLPVAIRTDAGIKRTGTMFTPTVTNSQLPGLLGLKALKQNRAVLDVNTNKLYFLGPGDYDLAKAMPPGTDCIQCETRSRMNHIAS